MSKVVRLADADDPALRAITRLQRLAHLLERSGDRPVPPVVPWTSAEPRPGDMPTFAEMMAVVERRGRGRRQGLAVIRPSGQLGMFSAERPA